MTTQTETIIWHKFPDEIPTAGWILVDTQPDHNIDIIWWNDNKPLPWLGWDDFIAWAELPKGWIDK